MQSWEYKVFASHLDPAELVVLLDESGREGWELIALASVVDDLPENAIAVEATAEALETEKAPQLVPVQAFRYIFKRPITGL
jgi:hypothetical protein